MSPLLNLCPELLDDIFTRVVPSDLAALTATCKSFKLYIKGNKLLWGKVFRGHYDTPPKQQDFNWEQELKKIVRMQKILKSEDVQVKRDNLASVARTVASFLEQSSTSQDSSRNVAILAEEFEKQENRDVFLFSSELYGPTPTGERQAGSERQTAAPTEEERKLSAQLHVYFGTSLDNNSYGRTRSGYLAAHPYARSRVYDLRKYNDQNSWGPYLDDGSLDVDWEKVESIMIDLGYNLNCFSEGTEVEYHEERDRNIDVYHMPLIGIAPYSYKSAREFICPSLASLGRSATLKRMMGREMQVLTEQPDPPLEARDPYGVTGTWRRVVCFLDYNDLYAFNFHSQPPEGHPREPITTQEAIRLITMKMQVCSIEEPGEEDGKGFPVVHFEGMSRSMHASWDPNANSKLIGSVRTTPQGLVRWTTLSIFHGEPRWRSESIQIGGIRSARGSIGTWFDKDYDANGPAGPTAFWKLCDEEDPGKEGNGRVFPSILAEAQTLFFSGHGSTSDEDGSEAQA